VHENQGTHPETDIIRSWYLPVVQVSGNRVNCIRVPFAQCACLPLKVTLLSPLIGAEALALELQQ